MTLEPLGEETNASIDMSKQVHGYAARMFESRPHFLTIAKQPIF